MADRTFVQQISPPTRITVNGQDAVDNLATKSTGVVDIGFDITAAISQVQGDKLRVLFQVSGDGFQSYSEVRTEWYKPPHFIPPDKRFHFTLGPLPQNMLISVRAYIEKANPAARSQNFNSFNFWTNRFPNPPELVAPNENSTQLIVGSVAFDWKFSDPDPGDDQVGYRLQWRQVVDNQNPGPWTLVSGGAATDRNVPAAPNFQANRYYEWQVQVQDPQGAWSEWSLTRSFYVRGASSPPLPLLPINDTGVDVLNPIMFSWQFRDPESNDTQAKADFRYRAVGTVDWTIVAGASMGNYWSYQMPVEVLQANVHYEWQVQTYDVGSGGSIPSDWSNSGTFYTIRTPGEFSQTPILGDTIIKGALGCGHHRVFVYQRGGQVPVGEITAVRQVVWKRQRDDIGNIVVDTSGWDIDCGDLLSRLRSWQHELVVFRDGERVAEGPVTRITYAADYVEIEAKDVMAYVYRRIMRQGYDDSYNCTQRNAQGDCIGEQLGINTVVYRAARIIIDALARGDSNVLPYLTPLNNLGDARQTRVVPDFAKTAWEEIDDLAATAGLDYVTVGRRILLWDTHYPIGKLPEMRDGDFSDPVIVTEYGMNLCNYYGVTDGSGVWGAAYPYGLDQDTFDIYYEGVEMLSSSYGDSDEDSVGATTPQGVAELRAKYASQAQRNISNRWPTPVVVRVPDNTTIRPEVNLGINQLVPGVWIPLRSTATLREVSQWQKLDTVTVTETADGETVQVIMSPAPNGGNDDPDATGQDGET